MKGRRIAPSSVGNDDDPKLQMRKDNLSSREFLESLAGGEVTIFAQKEITW